MDVAFADDDLERLEVDLSFNAGFDAAIVRSYRKLLQIIRDAPDERVFYALKSLHYEKLKGKKAHQRSMRLNIQWRLILEIVERSEKTVVILTARWSSLWIALVARLPRT